MKIKLTLEYLGTDFCGWQTQSGQPTIQNYLEQALTTILKSKANKQELNVASKIQIEGAGRTDSGVHALNQIATFDWPDECVISLEHLQASLNAITPRMILIKKLERVSSDFHPRFIPHLKCYSYALLLGKYRSPFYKDRAWSPPGGIRNIKAMLQAAPLLEGTHDFSSFRALDSNAKTTTRTVLLSTFNRQSEDLLVYKIIGKGFLKQMVRIIIGTLVEVGQEKREVRNIQDLLKIADRQQAGQTAPAYGLTLEWVRY